VGEQPFLTIIIPAYNEKNRLPPSLHKIAKFLRQQTYQAEVIVVENGSTDQTAQTVLDFSQQYVMDDDPFEVILLQSRPGKGAAVRKGMLHGRGEYLFICDTDLAMPIDEITKFLPPAIDAQNYPVAIASREAPGAVRYDEPFYRHLMGRVFNQLVRWMAVPVIQDTQCGFKCFSREAAELIFPLQQIDGWGFDVEVLYIARQHNLELVEIPINWYYQDDSRIRPIQDTFNMVIELIKIRRYGRQGLYTQPTG